MAGTRPFPAKTIPQENFRRKILFYACNKTEPVIHCFTDETTHFTGVSSKAWGEKKMSTEYIWETFDGLWKALHRQGRRVEELESRVVELESRLAERAASL